MAGLILCLLCLAALLAGCDPAAGKRPVDYPNSRWGCQDPHIEIVVDGKGRYTSTLVGADGEEKRFFLGFRSGYGVDAYVNRKVVLSDETLLFWGDCKFSKDRFTISRGQSLERRLFQTDLYTRGMRMQHNPRNGALGGAYEVRKRGRCGGFAASL